MDEVNSLKEKGDNEKLNEKGDNEDAYSRRDCVVLSGNGIPEATDGEIKSNVAINVFKNVLKLNVSPNDISTCHRLGRKPVSQGPDRRKNKIIVKLCRRDMKQELFGSCRKMKPRNVYINESLTKQRETIAYALRKMKHEHANVIKGVAKNICMGDEQ